VSKILNRLALLSALMGLAPAPAWGQVGHAPESSPYHDLTAHQAASVVTGYLGGSRGIVNVGPANGPMAGIRYDHIVGSPADIQIGLSYAHLQRFQVDPTKPVATRTTGPVNQDLVMMDAGLSLIVMGRKTWHGLSPFLGGTVGVAFETGLGGADVYQFGTKITLAPHLGFKWYPVQAFAVRIEGRSYFWKLTYPPAYENTPGGLGIPTVLPTGHAANEWTLHPALLVSVGYTFTH
jgi:hypothetical protein